MLCDELTVAELNVGPLVRLNKFPSLSVNVSVKVSPVKVTFPLFSTVIVYFITSPVSVIPLAFASVTVTVLVASIAGSGLSSKSTPEVYVMLLRPLHKVKSFKSNVADRFVPSISILVIVPIESSLSPNKLIVPSSI